MSEISIREMLARGLFNSMNQAWQGDGQVTITLTRYGDSHRYLMAVRNLYQSDEQVLWERVEER